MKNQSSPDLGFVGPFIQQLAWAFLKGQCPERKKKVGGMF